ncbi:YsnF/AvaK domain-containing protein [Massilia sp. CF038]|uniref:YsnF/AvaK domain-containing protein n=1 Tax=Massilia sp. CF038 TaxID=1881045 RepID=UPI00091134A0|nr:DUF2382 domain-containing protein [Massilia sp. CF038]SHG74253.1 protein of unknown function [Massilia sp. CF038]
MVEEGKSGQEALVIPVLREQVAIGIRKVDRGGKRIRKTVSVQEQPVEATLVRHTVEVRRVPVERIVAPAEAPSARQEGDTLIVPVLEEVLVLEKRVRIKEEIHIIRTAREEPFRDTVTLRSEQVSVEPIAPGSPTEATSMNGGTHHATHTDRRI